MTTEDIPDNVAQVGPRRILPPWLTRRRILTIAGIATVAVGLYLNWSWLSAIGAAPIILALLPCAAMCGLGMCMMGGGSKSCSTRNDGGDQ